MIFGIHLSFEQVKFCRTYLAETAEKRNANNRKNTKHQLLVNGSNRMFCEVDGCFSEVWAFTLKSMLCTKPTRRCAARIVVLSCAALLHIDFRMKTETSRKSRRFQKQDHTLSIIRSSTEVLFRRLWPVWSRRAFKTCTQILV